MEEKEKRFVGSMVGMAAADALGTTVEFRSPESFKPLTDIVGGGPFNCKVGEWTDDTQMALCLAQSLIDKRGFDPVDQLQKYLAWRKEGYMVPRGFCFDIGGTTSSAISAFERNGTIHARTTTPSNGSIMRLAPVPMMYAHDANLAMVMSMRSSWTTHAAPTCVAACGYMGKIIALALRGCTKNELLSITSDEVELAYNDRDEYYPSLRKVMDGSFLHNEPPKINGRGSAYNTLEAALWAFHRSSNFEEGALMAVNLGDDADTVGSVYGQIAGAHYGIDGIPDKWRKVILWGDKIEGMALALYELSKEAVQN
jgi:ADP-ribosyl-[dinitrogen reductase] hydrolase